MAQRGRKTRAETEFPLAKPYTDRHGVRRWRVRRRGKSVDIGPDYGAAAFRERYAEALVTLGVVKGDAPRKGARVTVRDYVEWYRALPQFQSLEAQTRKTYGTQLDKLSKERGHLPFKMMEREHLVQFLDTIKNPGSANAMLKVVKRLFSVAASRDTSILNIASGVEKRAVDRSFTCSEEPDIQLFFRTHDAPTPAHIAAMLALHTGAARVDVVCLGWANLYVGEDGELRLRYRRSKTGAVADMPVHKELADLLGMPPRGRATFLATRTGARRSPDGLANDFREATQAAGLTGLSLHGLRKALGRRIVEAGGTAHEVMAVLGHLSLVEAERYTRTYARKAAASRAIGKVEARGFTTRTKQDVDSLLSPAAAEGGALEEG